VNLKRVILMLVGLSGLVAVFFTGPAWAECKITSPTPNLVVKTDATKSCDNLTDHFGCRVDKGNGSCMAVDPDDPSRSFMVTSAVEFDGSVSWSLDPSSTIKIDWFNTNGGKQGGNGCGFNFTSDIAAAAGAGDENNGTFANVTSVDFCSNDKDEDFENLASADGQVLACFGADGTTSIDIFGAQLSCANVPDWQELTIIVARDKMMDPDTGEIVEDPHFGYTYDPETGESTGQVTLANHCYCAGSTPGAPIPQCDPDPDVINGPLIDGLVACEGQADRAPTGTIFQGSGYSYSGGSNRWY